MKTSKNIIAIILISFFVFISCIKKSNIIYDYDKYMYIYNKTNDTLLFNFYYITNNTNSESIVYPQCSYSNYKEVLLYQLEKIEIFKYNDTNLYIAFYKDNEPYNYKKNIYDFPSAWNKDTTIMWWCVRFYYSFSINYNNILNK